MVLVLVHPVGRVRLGGRDAKSEYGLWTWFAISLCASIGTGIVFWGGLRSPLQFAVEPQMSAGIEGGTAEAVIWSPCKSYLHWSFAPHATYGVFGIIVAFAYCNLRTRFSVSSGFAPLLGRRAEGRRFSDVVDTFAVFAITGSVAGSLGYGLLQIGSGLNTLFGIPATTLTFVVICICIVAIYVTSSAAGISRDIRWLSGKNA